MNREIKFRAWSPSQKQMSEPFWLNGLFHMNELAIGDLINDADDPIWLQYVGMVGKNGREIYEGDVVKAVTPDDDNPGEEFEYICAVQFGRSLNLGRFVSEYPASFVLFNQGFWHDEALIRFPHWSYEVIGNIYENPHLLDPSGLHPNEAPMSETTASDVESDINQRPGTN